MLTIRHIGNRGDESIYSVESVNWYPNAETREVVAFIPNGQPWHIKEGTVYVMNDMGKTVAKYDMECGEAVTKTGEIAGRRAA